MPGLGVDAIDGAPKPQVISKLYRDTHLAFRLLSPERLHPPLWPYVPWIAMAPVRAQAVSSGHTSVSMC